jgi:hypothetical protein
MPSLSFKQRFGFEESKPITAEFPESARIALAYLIDDLQDQHTFNDWHGNDVLNELMRTGRFTSGDLQCNNTNSFLDRVLEAIKRMQWWQVYSFCERVYRHHISQGAWVETEDDWKSTKSKAEMQVYFSDQLEDILAEENIAYQFVEGLFQRQGRAQTQKSIQRVGSVLGQARLSTVRTHYNKARNFFDMRPVPDVENCVKEALCALEACLEVLLEKPASKDFAKTVQQLKGNEARQIPPPIAEGMIKLHGYRGSGQGIAHAALEGNRVTELDAELTLSLVASYITYLVDLLSEPEDIPF